MKGFLSYMYGDFGEVPERAAFVVHCLLWAHFRSGAYYPVGGPGVIGQAIIPIIERWGGKVLVRARVSEILVADNTSIGVIVKGKKIFAPKIISTIGAPLTFTTLLPKVNQKVISEELKLLENPKIAPYISLMSMFIGIEGNADELNLPNQNYWIFPSWDHNKNWKRYMSDSMAMPAVFASFSSVKDPSYAKRLPNKQVALVIAPCMFASVEEYSSSRVKHRGDDYDTLKIQWMGQLTDIFLREFPQLEGKITYSDLGTAATNDFYLGTFRGAVYGLSHTPERYENMFTPQTPVQNLYLSGQDVVSCGIAGALLSGFYTAGQISKKALLRTAPMLG